MENAKNEFDNWYKGFGNTDSNFSRKFKLNGNIQFEWELFAVLYKVWQAAHERYAPEWKSPEETLPDFDEEVLIQTNDGVEIAHLDGYEGCFILNKDSSEVELNEVVGWMYVPRTEGYL